MKTILAINPGKKKRKSKTKTKRAPAKKAARKKSTSKGKKVMAAAKKRRSQKRSTTKRGGVRKYKRNPSARSTAKRAAKGARTILDGLQLQKSLIDATKGTAGALCTQLFAKKFGTSEEGGANDSNWTYKQYLLGLGGAFSAGVAAELVKKGQGKEFLKGGLTLLGYKLFVNEVAPQSEMLQSAFGEDTYPDYSMAGMGEDEVYLLGEDNNYYPAHEMAGELVQPGSLGAGELVAPGALGEDVYAEVMGRR